MRRSSRRKTRAPAGRSAGRCGHAITNSAWCGRRWPMCAPTVRASVTLIQHSAGSGKSNSIAWLAHQLIGLKRNEKDVFDSVIVVTDRRILDDQIQNTIKQFMQVGATVGHAEQFRRPTQVDRGGEENHHLHGAEVPVHPRRNRDREAARPSPSSSTRRTPAKAERQLPR